MTYTVIAALAKTGLTNQSRLPVKKALAVAPASKLVSAIARTQSLPHPKQPHASSVRCPAPAASTSSQRKVSPSAVVVPSARQTESIAKHLKRSQSVSKAHPVAVQQRLKPSHQSSVKTSLHSRSSSMSARKAEKSTEDQVLEALCSLRVSSPVSTVPILPGSRIPRRAATPPQNPTTRPVLRSCLVKKNVVLSTKVPSEPCRLVKRVRFGFTISSTRTVPEVHVFQHEEVGRKTIWPNMGKLKRSTMVTTGWVRLDDPIEVALPVGTVKFDFKMQSKRIIRNQNAPASQLSKYCGGPCADLRARGNFKMPAWFAAHPAPPMYFGRARPRCDNCYERSRSRKFEDGSYVIMEPADSSSSSVDVPWVLSLPLDDDDSCSSDDSSFVLDPEPLVDSGNVCKVTELVSTSTTMARSEACKCKDDSSDLSANLEHIDEPYDWENDPDIF